MNKFIIRNDDVAFDTKFEEIKTFCEICDKYGVKIIQAITPIGECKKSRAHMTNEEIKLSSFKRFEENQEVVEYLKSRNDYIGVHGLWHTHKPTEEEIITAKSILENIGLKPTFFVPPFNEGEYPEKIADLITCQLSQEKGQRLEDFLIKGTPKSPIVYLHSWRFDHKHYTFEQLDKCLQRLSASPFRLWYNEWVTKNAKGNVLDVGKSVYWDYGFPTIDINEKLKPTYVGNIENTKFADETFDTVLCNGMFEQVENPQKMIDEVYRITKKGGVIIFGFVGKNYKQYRQPWQCFDNNVILPDHTRIDFGSEYHFFICQKDGQSKIKVYTAITNDKDTPRSDIKVFSDYNKFESPTMNAKIYKILPHKFLDCEISIWLDGNIYLNVSPEQLVDEFLGEADLAVFEHNHSQSIQYEYKWIKYALRNRPKWTREEVDRQMDHYTKIGFPRKTGMAMCGMIIRRHTPLVNQFNEAWWAEICRWSQRDQLSFPVVRAQFPDLKVNYIKGNIKDHPLIRYEAHLHFNT